ncbi:F-box only protein 3 isoform X3 [Latimeria chalumnae]|uniref:F-box only protein 3 isoform X3 n=1 Tax=Latimeria chalumnae TaxID=7897 RepID=UPI0003C13939|nr:PREDICTED: F-box only protein 3 isoform X3 [Latimeria chalumnae]|eukprot:XP_006002060.1 PREDICTED: F-box only protein 3 isoform X3 [Latimeria chalumnae]
MAALQLVDLPADPLLLIFSFLDFPDFFSCSCVNRRFNQLSSHDPLWKRHCQKYWLVSDREKAQRNQSWKDIFRAFLSNDLGQYIEHYATLKQAWEDLKRFLGQTCPRMIGSLKAGATEAELDAVEARIGCKLPADYRCSFRIHNGQKLVVPGLMGSMALSNHYRSEDLLDIDTAAEGFQQRAGLKQCLPLTFCIHTGLSQYMALESVEGRERQEIFYQCQDQMAPNPSAIDMFLTGMSMIRSVWQQQEILLFQSLPRFYLNLVLFTHLTISSHTESGEFPILRPGNFYEYTSCTTFLTTSGCMEGHYTFHRLLNEEEVFNVTIPRFHMVCLPFRVSVVCKEGNHKGSVYEEDSTDTDDHEEVHRVLEFPVPGGHCPRHI